VCEKERKCEQKHFSKIHNTIKQVTDLAGLVFVPTAQSRKEHSLWELLVLNSKTDNMQRRLKRADAEVKGETIILKRNPNGGCIIGPNKREHTFLWQVNTRQLSNQENNQTCKALFSN